ncbi:DNA-binding protein [Barthadenovirus mellis]|uniref:DNA-binding protein n=1 Tax=Passerine adenovirus 1 TaxID=2779174 RepID=A0A7L9DI73_9ADEN|nr:DNA-binding protein [Passerine adenovirus 1]
MAARKRLFAVDDENRKGGSSYRFGTRPNGESTAADLSARSDKKSTSAMTTANEEENGLAAGGKKTRREVTTPPRSAGPRVALREMADVDEPSLSLTSLGALFVDPDERRIQEALNAAYRVGEYTGVSMEGYTLSPNEKHLEKAFGAYAKRRDNRPLTYSNTRSFYTFGGRLLLAAILRSVRLAAKFEPSGAVVWHHKWCLDGEDRDEEEEDGDDEGGTFRHARCFHGSRLVRKEIEYTVRANTAAACEAMLKGNGYAHTTKNNVAVVVVQSVYGVCPKNAREKVGTLTADSCGLAFSDVPKALSAMRYAEALTALYLPKGRTEGFLLMPAACDCNYGGRRIAGRQIPKMTPWAVGESRLEDLKKSLPSATCSGADERGVDLLAADPNVFVFQCCNFQNGRGRSGNRSATDKENRNVGDVTSKACDFRLSHPDTLRAFAIVKALLESCFEGKPLPLMIPRFEWSEALSAKVCSTTPGPSIVCRDTDPFGWCTEPSD